MHMTDTTATATRLAWVMTELAAADELVIRGTHDGAPATRRVHKEPAEGGWFHELATEDGGRVWCEMRYDGDGLAAELVALIRAGWTAELGDGTPVETEWAASEPS